MDNLQHYRQEIDAIDKQMLELLGKRFQYIEKVAQFKKINNMSPLQSNRWQEVLEKVKSIGQANNLDPVLIGVVWNTIHEFALEKEKEIIS